jgi:large repetitive protein
VPAYRHCIVRSIFWTLGVLIASAAIARGQDASRIRPATIEGIVFRVGTGEPLRAARVTLTGIAGAKSATTNDKGRFLIVDVSPGVYTVEASASLFVPSRKSQLQLSSDQHLRDVAIPLTPTAVITGHVYDQDQQPLASVRVEALRSQYRDGARTLIVAAAAHSDDRGEYRIYNLQSGAYYIRATPSGSSKQDVLAPAYYPGTLDSEESVPVRIAAGTEASAIDVRLGEHRTSSVQVSLAGAFENGVSGTTFSAVRMDRSAPESIAVEPQSLGNGVFRISPLRPGRYDIFAQVQVRNAASQWTVHTGRIAVTVNDQDVDGGVLAVRPNGSLKGQFVIAQPLAVPFDSARVEVALRPTAGSPLALATDSRDPGGVVARNGAFTIPNVANGRFRIEVSGLPENVFVTSIRYAGSEVIDSGIDLDGSPQSSLDVHLGGPGSVGTIAGSVRTENGQPVAGSVVVLVPAPGRRGNPAAFRTAITDSGGFYSVPGLLPGEYMVVASEDLEAGAYQSPDVIREIENRGLGVKTTVDSGGRQLVDVRSIRSDRH